ncbi:hypothetical protein D187_003981 [Cystobacter fuscus DSM 2262]|uniref:Uncharacterized protein n=1 Tax=Cystobacter fuscus (strain ATCC 25194 / DSM 2262 / NBRC 100088 / M29) TaxID=1242864 RepID=S9QB07_CYSF2|nr:hypothetical protein D187_003981 [Cystobacter fuscus DSM 2262]
MTARGRGDHGSRSFPGLRLFLCHVVAECFGVGHGPSRPAHGTGVRGSMSIAARSRDDM